MSDRKLSEITPEELARVMSDAEALAEGEDPSAYGWRTMTKLERWEKIEAAAMAILVLRGDDVIPSRDTRPDPEDEGPEPMGCWAERLERLGQAR